MTPANHIELEFANGVYEFRLGLKQLAELEANCGATLGAIFARVLKGRYILNGEQIGAHDEAAWGVKDLTEAVRLGLIGGGKGMVGGQAVTVDPIQARILVENYVVDRPLQEGWALAAAILGALIVGYQAKATPPPKKQRPAKPTGGSTTPAP